VFLNTPTQAVSGSHVFHSYTIAADLQLVLGHWLGEIVCQHLVGWNVLKLYLLASHALACEVVDDVDVLGPL
jgi:hypothetical protein